jgi:hypothetical protein
MNRRVTVYSSNVKVWAEFCINWGEKWPKNSELGKQNSPEVALCHVIVQKVTNPVFCTLQSHTQTNTEIGTSHIPGYTIYRSIHTVSEIILQSHTQTNTGIRTSHIPGYTIYRSIHTVSEIILQSHTQTNTGIRTSHIPGYTIYRSIHSYRIWNYLTVTYTNQHGDQDKPYPRVYYI